MDNINYNYNKEHQCGSNNIQGYPDSSDVPRYITRINKRAQYQAFGCGSYKICPDGDHKQAKIDRLTYWAFVSLMLLITIVLAVLFIFLLLYVYKQTTGTVIPTPPKTS